MRDEYILYLDESETSYSKYIFKLLHLINSFIECEESVGK